MSEVDISAQSANGWVLCIRASYGDEALARFIEAQQAEIERLRATYEPPAGYGCHVDAYFDAGKWHDIDDWCVLDGENGCRPQDCVYASKALEAGGKHTCEHWKPIKGPRA